jgi:hypothetical protein
MRRYFLDFTTTVFAVAGVMLLVTVNVGYSSNDPNSESDLLKTFLRTFVSNSRPVDKEKTRYVPAFVDLRDNGEREIIVYLTGDGWCGSGGCTTLILAAEGSSFRVVTKVFTTRPPIRVLKTKSNGWHDISVTVRVWYGEGSVYAREQRLSFTGKSYRPSAHQSIDRTAGEVVIPVSDDGVSLF